MTSIQSQSGNSARTGTDTQAARRAMIDSQLRPSGVNEPWVLTAMASIAREDFVPASMRSAAYIDRAIPLGNGQSLAAPLVHGMMLAEAAPRPDDTILLIGDGNGYLAALLRNLAGSLDSLDPESAASAQDAGAYSLVIVDGAIEVLPPALASQLAEDGRIVTGLVEQGVTRLAAGRKAAGQVALIPLAEIGIPVLPEFAATAAWSF